MNHIQPASYKKIKGTDQTGIQTVIKKVQDLENSYGLKPFKLIRLSHPVLKNRLLTGVAGFSGSQEDAELLVFTARQTISKEDVNEFLSGIQVARHGIKNALQAYSKRIEAGINRKNNDGKSWSEKQASFAVNIMRKTAEATGIQFTLLRGVDAAAVNRHINTGEGRWHTFAVIALTYPEGCQVSKQLINIA